MTSLFENLKMKGGGNIKPGCPNDVHFKLHKISKGRSQKHSFFGLNLLTLPSCNCEFDLWCEYPESTKVDGNGVPYVDQTSLKNFIDNILTFISIFKTERLVMRMQQMDGTHFDFSIKDKERMYYCLTGDNSAQKGDPLPSNYINKAFPFYSLEDNNDESTMAYLMNQIKTKYSNVKVYILPYVGFDAGNFGYGFIQSKPRAYQPAHPSATPPTPEIIQLPSTQYLIDPGFISYLGTGSVATNSPPSDGSTPDSQKAVDSFWSAVEFCKYYSNRCNSKIGKKFDGIIIETEDSQLAATVITDLPGANTEIKKAYTLFNTETSLILQNNLTDPVLNYKTSHQGNTDVVFGLTGSTTITKTRNMLNEVSVMGAPIKITNVWPQYYQINDDTIASYDTGNRKKVVNAIKAESNWVPSDNSGNFAKDAAIGMLSIETPYERKYLDVGPGKIDTTHIRATGAFFGNGKFDWDDVCYVSNNAIVNRKLENGNPLRAGIFAGNILSSSLSSEFNQGSAHATIKKMDQTGLPVSSC